jgi:DNA-directed RNA polymerase specialized sigma24 family protein
MRAVPSEAFRLVNRAANYELPMGALSAICELRADLDAMQKQAIASARAKGATMDEIADVLGVTRQAVYQWLNRRPKSDTPGA